MAKNKQPKNLKDQKAPSEAAARRAALAASKGKDAETRAKAVKDAVAAVGVARRAAVAASQNKDAATAAKSTALPKDFGVKKAQINVTKVTKRRGDGKVMAVTADVSRPAKKKPATDVRVGKPKKLKPAPAPMPGRQATPEEMKKIADRKAAAKDKASRDIAGNLLGATSSIEEVKENMTRSERAASVIAAEKGRSHKYAATPVADAQGGVSPRWQLLGYDSAHHMLHHPTDGRFPQVKAGQKAKGPKISHEDWVAKHDAKLASLGAIPAPADSRPVGATEKIQARREAAKNARAAAAGSANIDEVVVGNPSGVPAAKDPREVRRAAAKEALIKADPLGLRK